MLHNMLNEKQEKIKTLCQRLKQLANRRYWERILHCDEPLQVSKMYMTQECFDDIKKWIQLTGE